MFTLHLRLRVVRCGFTLVELLVVIAIIAVLVGILFPVFARAREKARQSSCISNLKQISLGIKQYAQDYDGSYPTSKTDVKNDPATTEDESLGVLRGSGLRGVDDPLGLPVILAPYLKSKQIFICPSGREELQNLGNTYQYNGNASLLNPDEAESDSAGYLLLWDCYSFKTVTPVEGVVSPTPNLSVSNPAIRDPYCAHFENFNQLFLDGHVKMYSWKLAGSLCRK